MEARAANRKPPAAVKSGRPMTSVRPAKAKPKSVGAVAQNTGSGPPPKKTDSKPKPKKKKAKEGSKTPGPRDKASNAMLRAGAKTPSPPGRALPGQSGTPPGSSRRNTALQQGFGPAARSRKTDAVDLAQTHKDAALSDAKAVVAEQAHAQQKQRAEEAELALAESNKRTEAAEAALEPTRKRAERAELVASREAEEAERHMVRADAAAMQNLGNARRADDAEAAVVQHIARVEALEAPHRSAAAGSAAGSNAGARNAASEMLLLRGALAASEARANAAEASLIDVRERLRVVEAGVEVTTQAERKAASSVEESVSIAEHLDAVETELARSRKEWMTRVQTSEAEVDEALSSGVGERAVMKASLMAVIGRMAKDAEMSLPPGGRVGEAWRLTSLEERLEQTELVAAEEMKRLRQRLVATERERNELAAALKQNELTAALKKGSSMPVAADKAALSGSLFWTRQAGTPVAVGGGDGGGSSGGGAVPLEGNDTVAKREAANTALSGASGDVAGKAPEGAVDNAAALQANADRLSNQVVGRVIAAAVEAVDPLSLGAASSIPSDSVERELEREQDKKAKLIATEAIRSSSGGGRGAASNPATKALQMTAAATWLGVSRDDAADQVQVQPLQTPL